MSKDKINETNIIELKGLAFGYQSRQAILSQIDLKLPFGALVLIEGCNGSGKTTLARLLLGLLTPFSGKAIRNYKKASYVPQQSALDRQYPYSLGNLLLMGVKPGYFFFQSKGEHEQKVREMQALMGLEKHKDLHFSKASGGQVQRALIGASLLSQADLLVLDEPFVYLDKQIKNTVEKLLLQKNREENLTLCIIDHSIEKHLAKSALPFTHYVRIEAGRVSLAEP